MNTGVSASQPIELCIVHPQNRILIETHGGSIVIHAARDNFSAREKCFFVRYLAAEGFIPARYEWFSDPQTAQLSGLIWLVDSSWTADSEPQRKAFRQIVRVILWGFLLWLALMTFALVHAPP